MALPFARLFSMGAFDGLLRIRHRLFEFPELDVTQALDLLRALNADAPGLDFDAAIELHDIVSLDAPLTPRDFFRRCIQDVVATQESTWLRSIMLGRTRVTTRLSRDEYQCFRSAELLDELLSESALEWWHDMSLYARSLKDEATRARARAAEKLSLDYESARIASLGIARAPRWMAIDDNTAGYDILSYDRGPVEPTNRMVEVKSTISSPLRFYVSRNEWDQALKFGDAYYFHIWDLSKDPPQRYERTVAQVLPHVPADSGSGKWSTAEIPVSVH